MRSIIVEDHAEMRDLLAAALDARGHEVVCCPGVAAAREAWSRCPADLVVVDRSISDGDGLDFCRWLCGRQDGKTAVVLLVTELNAGDGVSEALAAGATDVLAKPLTLHELDARLAVAEARVAGLRAEAKPDAKPDAERRPSESRLQALLEGGSDMASLLDRDGIMRFISPACRRILGRGPDGLLGEHAAAMVVPDDVNLICDFFAQLATRPGAVEAFEVRVRHCDGSARRLEGVATNRIHDSAVGGFVVNWRDVTQVKETEAALAAERELLGTVLEFVPDFLYVKDAESRFVRVSRALARFLDLDDPRDATGKTDFDFFPAELAAQFSADERAVLASGVPLFNKLEPQDAAAKRWFLTSTAPIRDGQGTVTGLVGVSRDVTERREAEERIREAEGRYRSLVEQLPAVVYVEEVKAGVCRLTYISPRVEQVIGWSAQDFLAARLRWEDRVHPDDLSAVVSADRLAHSTSLSFLVEYRHRTKQGGWVWVREEALRLQATDDGCEVWQGILFDLSDRKALEDRLAHAAAHDALTGLPNRVLLGDRLEQALAREARDRRGLALLFADLDDFKFVNDSLGHKAGDELLVEVTRRLGRCVRDGDTVARLGGDEFTLVLEGVGAGRATRVAERVVDELRRPFTAGGAEVRVSTSVGIAIARPGDGADDLLRRADAAMYQAKRQGKARCAHADPAVDVAV